MADQKENQMGIITNPTYIRCLDSSGNSKKVTPADVIKTAGDASGYIEKNLTGSKWYRIAIGNTNNSLSSALINIGNSFTTYPSRSCLFYVSASGYTDCVVTKLANSDYYVSKVRLLTKESTTGRCMMDVYIRPSGGSQNNTCYISYSCNIGFDFQSPVEVSETPDAGYEVSEFSLV